MEDSNFEKCEDGIDRVIVSDPNNVVFDNKTGKVLYNFLDKRLVTPDDLSIIKGDDPLPPNWKWVDSKPNPSGMVESSPPRRHIFFTVEELQNLLK